jgi:hypothetical protein
MTCRTKTLRMTAAVGLVLLAGCEGAESVSDGAGEAPDPVAEDWDNGEGVSDGAGEAPDPVAEDCDNGLDDDGNGRRDCDDATCLEEPYCRPEHFAAVVGVPNYYTLEGVYPATIIVASDCRGREPRLLRVTLDGLPSSLEESEFLAVTVGEGWEFYCGMTAGVHHITLDVDGEAVWDFGEVEFREGRNQTLIAFGGLDDPATLVFEAPSGLEPNDVVVRMVNVWDTREPLDVLLCPPDTIDWGECRVVAEDLRYGEVWEQTIDRRNEDRLGWERPLPAGFPDDRFIALASQPAGRVLCFDTPSGPRTVFTTMHMQLPLSVSLDPECLGCSAGHEVNEPYPPDGLVRPSAYGPCE